MIILADKKLILLQGLAGELVNVLREAGQIVPTSLTNFGTHVKKKVCFPFLLFFEICVTAIVYACVSRGHQFVCDYSVTYKVNIGIWC